MRKIIITLSLFLLEANASMFCKTPSEDDSSYPWILANYTQKIFHINREDYLIIKPILEWFYDELGFKPFDFNVWDEKITCTADNQINEICWEDRIEFSGKARVTQNNHWFFPVTYNRDKYETDIILSERYLLQFLFITKSDIDKFQRVFLHELIHSLSIGHIHSRDHLMNVDAGHMILNKRDILFIRCIFNREK